MEKCLHCSKELKHVPGRKQKSFCNVNCRNKYFYAQRKKQIEMAKSALQSLPADFLEVKNIGILTKNGEIQPIFEKPHKKPKNKRFQELKDSPKTQLTSTKESYDAPQMSNGLKDELEYTNQTIDLLKVALEKKIIEIKAEKIPKERDTVLGRKAWQIEQNKRIQELKNKLK